MGVERSEHLQIRTIANDSDECRLVVGAIAVATIGLAGLGFQPVMVAALIGAGKFSAEAAGYAASAEVFGIAATNLATALVGKGVSWRLQSIVGIFLLICGGAASVAAEHATAPLMVARFISGLGSGVLISRGYAAAGLSRNPDRLLGYLLATSTAHVAVGSFLLPRLIPQWGLSAIFIYYGLLALVGLMFVRWMPVGVDAAVERQHSGSSLMERVSALAAAAFLFTGLGVLWAYLFQIALSMGAGADEAAVGLSISQIAAFAGALIASLAGRKVPALAMLLTALVITTGSVTMFPVLTGALAYAVLAAGFNGSSNTAMVLVLGAVAEADINGKLIAAAVTAQTLGFAFGPALAALFVKNGNFLVPEIMSATLITASGIASIVVALARRRRRSETSYRPVF